MEQEALRRVDHKVILLMRMRAVSKAEMSRPFGAEEEPNSAHGPMSMSEMQRMCADENPLRFVMKEHLRPVCEKKHMTDRSFFVEILVKEPEKFGVPGIDNLRGLDYYLQTYAVNSETEKTGLFWLCRMEKTVEGTAAFLKDEKFSFETVGMPGFGESEGI